MNNTPEPIATQTPKKSVLVPIGVFLILFGIFMAPQLEKARQTMEPGTLRTYLLLVPDLLRLGMFVGVACAMIGARRNRKMKQEQTNAVA